MSEDVKLEPCPFCGGEAVSGTGYTDYGDFGWVECTNCPAIMSSDMGTEAEAITKWNTRHDPQAAYERGKAEERARIVKELEVELKALDGHYDDDDLGAQDVFQTAINIVNQTE